jgi:hypothetical protein
MSENQIGFMFTVVTLVIAVFLALAFENYVSNMPIPPGHESGWSITDLVFSGIL